MKLPAEDVRICDVRLGDLLVEHKDYLYSIVVKIETHDHLDMITLTIATTPTLGNVSLECEKLDAYENDRIGQWGYSRRAFPASGAVQIYYA